MVGDARTFLRYNKEEIFKALIQAEGHLRNMRPGAQSQDLSCVVKHLADAEAHADEAISHAAELGDDELSRRFMELRDRIRELRRMIMERPPAMEEAIRRVRELRRLYEAFNPEFDVSKCRVCGVEVMARHGELQAIEEETAHRILEHLSRKYNVPKPKLRFLDQCPRPEPATFGMYTNQGDEHEILLCRGGASVHILLHEFGHYLARLKGIHMSEEGVEAFALKEVSRHRDEKLLYAPHPAVNRMAWATTGIIVGGQHVAKGIERGLRELDRALGRAAAPVLRRPSTWITALGGVALVLIPRFVRVGGTTDLFLTTLGGHLTTQLWDIAEEAMAGAAAGAAVGGFVAAAPITVTTPPTTAPTTAPTREQVF
jgi:hypothetical protein